MTRRSLWAALAGVVGLKAQIPESSENVLGTAWDERKPRNGQCPVCGKDGTELGAVAIGDGSGRYVASVAWLPKHRLCWCEHCGNLFATRRDAEREKP